MTTYDENRLDEFGDEDVRENEMPRDVHDADTDLLFSAANASSFRDRWSQVQSRFVDDPQGAVQAADVLVTEVTQSLVKNFAQQREELESQWSDDNDVETEELRLALRRYRALFERLLVA